MPDRKDKKFTKENLSDFSKRNNVQAFEEFEPEWVKMSEIEAKTQPWFWPGIIPSSTLTLFGGRGGIGKSLLLLYLASKTSSGEAFHSGGIEHKLSKGSVILLSAEDDAEQQIKPKLVAMNADCEKINLLTSKIGSISGKKKFIELTNDLNILENKIKELHDVKLIIIDPITYFIGDLRDNYNCDVANFLQSLICLAKKYDIAVILNKHLRKSSTGVKGVSAAVDEVGGAGAWTNTPRRSWLITNHPEEPLIKIITKMKDNIGSQENECLGYKITPVKILQNNSSIETTTLCWLQEMQRISAEDAVNETTYEKSKLQYAIDYIFAYLKENGQSVVAHICEKALKKGIKEKTFRRATVEIEENHTHMVKLEKGIRGAKIYSLTN